MRDETVLRHSEEEVDVSIFFNGKWATLNGMGS